MYIHNIWRILLLIYAAGGLVVFIGVLLFWIWVITGDKEKESYSERGAALILLTALITSIAAAVVWVGIPLIWVYGLVHDKMAGTAGKKMAAESAEGVQNAMKKERVEDC